MRLLKLRVRSEWPGKVLSVRSGSGRKRIAVDHRDNGVKYYFVAEARVPTGRKVRKGTVLGYV